MQTLHWTCAWRMCSNQTIRVVGSLSTPWSSFSCLKRCHPIVFAWDVWSCLGQKTEHNNSSDPLNTSTDGSAPSPCSVTAARTASINDGCEASHFLFHSLVLLIWSTQHYDMPRSWPFLMFFTDMGSTVLCRVHTGLLCVLQQVDRCIFQL